MQTLNLEQHTGETNAQYVERLRVAVRAQKEVEQLEALTKRYLEDSLTMLRSIGAPVAARLDVQRLLSLCCHRLGVVKGNQDILTARIVTAQRR